MLLHHEDAAAQVRFCAARFQFTKYLLANDCMVGSTSFSLDRYAQEVRQRIDQALSDAIEFDAGCPEELAAAIRYSLLAPGKRLRPMLVLAAAEACQGERAAAMPAFSRRGWGRRMPHVRSSPRRRRPRSQAS